VIPASAEFLRFLGLGVAVLVTAVHLVMRRNPDDAEDGARSQASQPFPSMRLARRCLVVVGAFALATSLLMGVIKESGRGNYGVYGELTQAQASQQFTPSPSLYP
jgi:hypothetical protein